MSSTSEDSSESDEEFLEPSPPAPKNLPKKRSNPQLLKKVKYEKIQEPPAKKAKKDLYKPPTVEELNQLKETENLYNNNLFRLQIDELIKETKIKSAHINIFNTWLDAFKSLMEELPEFKINTANIKWTHSHVLTKEQRLISDLAKCNTCDYGNMPPFDLKLKAPEGVEVFGLYKLGALPGRNLNININLRLPRSLFQARDYLNNTYFSRRLYYLTYISHFLKKSQICERVNFALHEYKQNLPILHLTLREEDNIFVNVYVTPPDNFFKLSRCLPAINNFRFDDSDENHPTPLYNATLGHNLTLRINNNFIEETLQGLDNVKEAIKLIRIWLLQRDLDECLSENLTLYFIVYLIMRQKINKFMSSYQVVRNFWSFFCETDLTEGYISISESIKNENLDDFKKYYDVVFFDRTGYYNVAAFLTVDIYKKVKYECELAFRLLDDGGLISFQHLFTTKLPLELQYDVIVTVEIPRNEAITEEYLRFFPFNRLRGINKIITELKRGLNKRASIIAPLPEKLCLDSDSTTFGINLDETEAFSVLEKGPALNDPREKDFRDFWGLLSSDRRFKDGSVNVVVYFDCKTIKDRRDIIKKILTHVLQNRLRLEFKILCFNDLEEQILVNKRVETPYPVGTNEEGCFKITVVGDELGKILRSLQLPLSITGVQGISDVFSYAEVFPPIATTYRCSKLFSKKYNNIVMKEKVTTIPNFVQPIECVLKLEHSSKWPQTLEGVRKMKTAFYLEIHRKLSKNHEIVSSVKENFIDVLYEGFVFRYHIYLPHEISLMKKGETEDGVTVYKDTSESLELEQRFDVLPKITGALKGLQAQYPTFGPGAAMVKRWLRAQLIDDYLFPDMAINLIMAAIYLNCAPYRKPATPQLSFLRWLKFVSDLQVEIQPVVVNFNDTIPKDVLAEIDSKLLKNRDQFPHLFIVTPFDNYESVFTKVAPKKEILRQVKRLVDRSLTYLYKELRGCVVPSSMLSFCMLDIRYKKMIVPNMLGYHLIINIKGKANPRKYEDITSQDEKTLQLKPYDKSKSQYMPVVNFNPIQSYLSELRKNYGEFALFFHNTYGGNKIGVVWKPQTITAITTPKEFKLLKVAGHRKTGDGKMELNMNAIIEDFHILGKGLVATIDQK